MQNFKHTFVFYLLEVLNLPQTAGGKAAIGPELSCNQTQADGKACYSTRFNLIYSDFVRHLARGISSREIRLAVTPQDITDCQANFP